jgi:hypothetical protein
MKNYTSKRLIGQDIRGYYIKLCKGCRTYEEGIELLTEDERKEVVYLCNVSVPFIPPFIPEDKKPVKICPCSDCIVKMVCLTKCELLEEHISHKVIRVGDEKR